MEITTIIGIAAAILIMFLGLRMILKKPSDAAPSLESELHINEDCQKPVIPRHVRDQLQKADAVQERVEPVLNADSAQLNESDEKPEPKAVTAETLAHVEEDPAAPVVDTAETSLEIKKDSAEKNDTEQVIEQTESDKEASVTLAETVDLSEQLNAAAQPEVTESEKPAVAEFTLNNAVEKAEITEFNEESSILDAHLHEQRIVDEESALSTAEDFIALNMYTERRVLAGDKALKVLLKYGLRYGEMACFHRYNEDGTKLLFSVLQITDEGAAGFDLESLSSEQVKGLAFFLALPHADVQNAFDTMISISGLIAREIDGTIYDQNHLEFTPQLREHWRHQAIDYRAGQKTIA